MDMTDAANTCVLRAITHLSRAAACMERTEGRHGAEQTWFVVRSVAVEHGANYEEAVARAREYASELSPDVR